MSSGAIMALIKEKEKELKKLKTTQSQVSTLSTAVDCMSSKFKKAGELISEAGTIGGELFDNGRTAVVGENFKKISNGTNELLSSVETTISKLEAEISDLYESYEVALAAEEAKEKMKKWYNII